MGFKQMEINKQISNIKSELDNVEINKQRKRHLEDELSMLNAYHKNHPEVDECPTHLELYCDSNPNAPECRVYDL
jgi:hypothetical protein